MEKADCCENGGGCVAKRPLKHSFHKWGEIELEKWDDNPPPKNKKKSFPKSVIIFPDNDF